MLGLPLVLVALAGFFAGATFLVAVSLGAATKGRRPDEQMRRSLEPYRAGPADAAADDAGRGGGLAGTPLARSAVDLSHRIVVARGLDRALEGRLESAGLPLRAGEWLLLHVGVAVGGGLLLLALSGGHPAGAFLGLLLGLAGPWVVLVVREGRRRAAFLDQLPDTLQLVSSGLKAGHSLPQALDTVVRQGSVPMSTEFSRVMAEHQLGVPVEDALDRLATRLGSDDFSWVVMAVRIQRDVGGNLAELLATVADTLRERERLRRQVSSLSAEGRLSGLILGALPVVFAVYLVITKPDYLRPMATPFGIVLDLVGVGLMAVGSFWMVKVVKVDV